ncbi:MAG TPA: sulfatase-like hydrolase/transferase [Gemmataceae bacterium]|nr:sulfatase-like hydrolase/transferase [Gemmataceae bacterium]
MTRFLLALVALELFSVPGCAAERLRPNVLLVLADDLGWGDLSCYGGKLAATPHLDRMAKEGVRFTQFYVASPICSPSRCGILTGQFPARWRITSYLQTQAGNRACEQADFLDPHAPSLPRVLKRAGYATSHVGKWHLGGGRDVKDPPKFAAYGYDLGLGTWESPQPHPDLTARDWIWSAEDRVPRWDRTHWMVDHTHDFLQKNADRPCFVNLWLDDVHTPWVPSAEDQQVGRDGRASGKGDTPDRLRRVVKEMDRQVGRLLDALRDRNADRPTLVLFLGDNGPLPTFEQQRTAGLRGSKLSLYEGGIRVPCLAWGPGLVPAGLTNDTTVFAAVDLFPTLCKLCGADLPEGYGSDGEDLSPVLVGKSLKRTLPLFWEYGRNEKSFAYPGGKNRSPNLAVRVGDWKLLVNADGTGAELYDLATGPKEIRDQRADRSDVAKRLTDQALKWRKSLP